MEEAYFASRDFLPELTEWVAIARQMRLELAHVWDAILALSVF